MRKIPGYLALLSCLYTESCQIPGLLDMVSEQTTLPPEYELLIDEKFWELVSEENNG